MNTFDAKVPVLDGYVQLIEHMGSEESIIEAARMSVGGGFVSWEPYDNHPRGDQGLLEYLWKNKHATPFEMCQVVFEIQAPIFVFREWHRHRTQSYNEHSARYAPLPDLNYCPSMKRIKIGAGMNKQAKGVNPLANDEQLQQWLLQLQDVYARAQEVYQLGLKRGVPKELARLALPVARYSTMRASANLRNWFAFLTLRMDSHAQWEIRQYANAVAFYINQLYPRTYAMFLEETNRVD